MPGCEICHKTKVEIEPCEECGRQGCSQCIVNGECDDCFDANADCYDFYEDFDEYDYGYGDW